MKHAHPDPHRYLISGLMVASEFPLPMRLPVDPGCTLPADVTLRVGDVPAGIDNPTHRGATWMSDGRRFLLDLPDIGRFFAEDGCRLTLMPAKNVDLDDILVFATGTALAAILYQRGAWLLHGSAVVHKNRAFVVCAHSGSGKSTLASALVQAGCDFFSDDVCAVECTSHGQPHIQSDGRALRLYPDSISHTGMADGIGPPVRKRLEKFHVVPPRLLADRELPAILGGIYLLADSNAAFPPGIIPMKPIDAAQALLDLTYRRRLALAHSGHGQLAMRAARLLSRVPVYHLRRPRDFTQLESTAALLRAHWEALTT